MVEPRWTFLRGDDESNNEATARCAEEVLAGGTMASTLRVPVYTAFLDAYDGQGARIRGVSTSCAMFAGGCLINASVLPSRPPPKARAITTWVGLGGFSSRSWIPAAELVGGPKRGDVLYVCSTAGQMSLGGGKVYTWTKWGDAANGHVIVVLADGWVVPTAEGGGSPGGTGCRLSSGPKDLRAGRPPRGVWRPDLIPHAAADTDPAPPPEAA